MSLQITDEEFSKIRQMVFNKFGINLTEEKKSLLVGRLQSILQKHQLKDFESYYQLICNAKDQSLLSELVNKISTNFTYFYREEKHFIYFINEFIPTLIESLKKSNQKDMRFWCAGCSSGEEPYTIIMMLMDKLKNSYLDFDAGILATDISQNALDFAANATYPNDRLIKLPPNLKNEYFTKIEDPLENEHKVIDKVIREVTFRRFNLMNETFPFKKPFHTILCRNVMIYFDKPTKDTLIKKFHDQLVPGGLLFIGHSETLGRDHNYFDYVMPAVYRKKGDL